VAFGDPQGKRKAEDIDAQAPLTMIALSSAPSSSSSKKKQPVMAPESIHEVEVPEHEVQHALVDNDSVNKDLKTKLDTIFLAFLERVCSDGKRDKLFLFLFSSFRTLFVSFILAWFLQSVRKLH